MLALISVIGFGVAAGGVIGAIFTGDPLYTVTWSVAFAIACVAAVFAMMGAFSRGLRAA